MRPAILVVLGVLGACGFQITAAPTDGGDATVPDDVTASSWLAGFDYRKKITFTSGTTTTLAHFVAAVLVPADAELAANARDDRRDLVFTGPDQLTELDYEIERFDGATGALAAWVRIESFTPTSEIYLYYGGGPADGESGDATWPAARYGAVWHLTDPQPGSASDSTPNALTLTAPGASTAPALADGLVAGGRSYDGVDDTLLRAGAISASLTHGTNPYSYGAWVFVTANQGMYDMLFYKGGANSGDPGYDIELGTGNWMTYVCDSSVNIIGASFGQAAALMSRWVHIIAVVDRDTQRLRLYTDGVEVASQPISTVGSTSSMTSVALGRSQYPLRGTIDEMRVYKTALSPEWIGAEYRNVALSTRDAFRTIGAQEMRP